MIRTALDALFAVEITAEGASGTEEAGGIQQQIAALVSKKYTTYYTISPPPNAFYDLISYVTGL